MKLSQLAEGQPCPKSELRDPGAHLGAGLGDGPVYAFGVNLHDLAGGHPSKVAWGAAPTYIGPIRIRGGRLDGVGRLLLGSFDNRWRGTVETIDGSDLMPELDLLESHSTLPNVPAGWRMWPSVTFVATPGCYAWQVDGVGFTEVITFQI